MRRLLTSVLALSVTALLGLLAGVPRAAPAEAAPAATTSTPFTDIGDSIFKADIEWLYYLMDSVDPRWFNILSQDIWEQW